MSATRQEIKEWLEEAKRKGSTHLIVACDTFDYDNYPIYISPQQDGVKEFEAIFDESTTVDEVYNLSMDIEAQLKEIRARNF